MIRPEDDLRPESRLDQLLAESAAAEEKHPPVDVDRLVNRLRARVFPEHGNGRGLDGRRSRAQWLRVAATAAAIPLAIGIWIFCTEPSPGDPSRDGFGTDGVEVALVDVPVLEELDLLLLLENISPEELSELDPDLIDLYQHVDVIDDLPVEVLGSSDS